MGVLAGLVMLLGIVSIALGIAGNVDTLVQARRRNRKSFRRQLRVAGAVLLVLAFGLGASALDHSGSARTITTSGPSVRTLTVPPSNGSTTPSISRQESDALKELTWRSGGGISMAVPHANADSRAELFGRPLSSLTAT